jgi:1-acyl-sn-glycerol-3-phosphate acyltransferase
VRERHTTSLFRNTWFFSVEKLIEMGYSPAIYGLENLRRIHEHSDKPLVVFSNHVALDDPFLVQWLMLTHLRPRMNDVIVPVSDDYADASRSQMMEYAYVVKLYKGIGIQMPHIVQTYRLRQKDSAGSAQKTPQLEQLQRKSEALVKEFDRVLDAGFRRSASLYLAPEGHRSDNGSLRPAESGLGYIVGKMRRFAAHADGDWHEATGGLVLPIAITHSADFTRQINFHIGPRHKMAFHIGQPQSTDEVYAGTRQLYGQATVKFKHVSHYLMTQLAAMLPDEMKGFYHPDILSETLWEACGFLTVKKIYL